MLTHVPGNCQQQTANTVIDPEEKRGLKVRMDLPPPPSVVSESCSICKVGSNFQLIEIDPMSNSSTSELSFNLRFQANTDGDIICQFLIDLLDFIETVVNVETDTEELEPDELKIDDELLKLCQNSVSS